MAIKMRIEIYDDKILVDNENDDNPFVIMKKPDIDDYSNITARPLVATYHLTKETIWERACHYADKLQLVCGESQYFACYILIFMEMYPMLLSSSQVKNVIFYGMEEESEAVYLFREFMDFLQMDNALVQLPPKPNVFSTILNKSCHAAIVSLDVCNEMRTICDIVSKIRIGGKVFLYTINDRECDCLSGLFSNAKKNILNSCVLYSITVNADVSTFAFENNSEALILPLVNDLLNKFEEIKNLTPVMKIPDECPLEVYPYAIEIMDKMERMFLELYDVLENPDLPVLANTLKESLMDFYIGSSNGFNVQTYLDRMCHEMEKFCEMMEIEFG
ncbi:MAG: hypothetical protein HDR29_02820 [Lachnospiraceae bacterium]|nr:hypothetical protein [Lachnospiraceae bacterium]